jgi:hypothetical protein
LPSSITVTADPSEKLFDIIQVFFSKKYLEDKIQRLKPHLAKNGMLWVTYPKGTSTEKVEVKEILSVNMPGLWGCRQ